VLISTPQGGSPTLPSITHHCLLRAQCGVLLLLCRLHGDRPHAPPGTAAAPKPHHPPPAQLHAQVRAPIPQNLTQQHMVRGHRGVATPAIRQAWRCVVLKHCGPHKWVANPRDPPAAQKGGTTPALCRRHRQPEGVWRDEQRHHAAGAAEQAAPAMQACTMIGRLSNA
jgi:hypothetical protein